MPADHPGTPDHLLAAYLRERENGRSDELLSELIAEHALPVIERVIRGKLARFRAGRRPVAQDIPELRNTAAERLTRRLREMKLNQEAAVIDDFSAYTARTADNTCKEYVRGLASERQRFKNSLRYVLGHHSGFALWSDRSRGLVCGLGEWTGRAPVSLERLARSRESTLETAGLADKDLLTMDRSQLLSGVFQVSGAPIVFDDLVSLLADWAGLEELRIESGTADEDQGEAIIEMVPDSRPAADLLTVHRQFVERLWSEICLLPMDQRRALLLNLRGADGGDIRLIEWLGLASIRQIAGVLEWEPQRLAAVWNDLPIEDSRIGAELGCTRQQVINLRNSARKRLARRVPEWS